MKRSEWMMRMMAALGIAMGVCEVYGGTIKRFYGTSYGEGMAEIS